MNSHFQHLSHLFTLRLWNEPLGDGLLELGFQIQHVLSGASRVFRDEAELLAYLRTMMEELEREGDGDPMI